MSLNTKLLYFKFEIYEFFWLTLINKKKLLLIKPQTYFFQILQINSLVFKDFMVKIWRKSVLGDIFNFYTLCKISFCIVHCFNRNKQRNKICFYNFLDSKHISNHISQIISISQFRHHWWILISEWK